MEKLIGTQNINDIIFITLLFSELSIEEAEGLRKDLLKLADENNKKFIINAEKCDFLPSVALGVLVDFIKVVQSINGKIVFCNINEHLRSIFKITKLEKQFIIHQNKDDAIKALA